MPPCRRNAGGVGLFASRPRKRVYNFYTLLRALRCNPSRLAFHKYFLFWLEVFLGLFRLHGVCLWLLNVGPSGLGRLWVVFTMGYAHGYWISALQALEVLFVTYYYSMGDAHGYQMCALLALKVVFWNFNFFILLFQRKCPLLLHVGPSGLEGCVLNFDCILYYLGDPHDYYISGLQDLGVIILFYKYLPIKYKYFVLTPYQLNGKKNPLTLI